MTVIFADRTETMRASEIRESYKLMEIPGMISLASGSPDPSLFPIREWRQAGIAVMEEMGENAMAYGTTDGYDPLRKKIAERMRTKAGFMCNYSDIQILSGSQQGLELAARILVNEGDYIVCENPSYMGAFNAFGAYMPRYIGIMTDENGMLPTELEQVLSSNDRIKMIYVIPNFQNPTGYSWSLERRKVFMEIVNRYEIPVIEDDPYGEIIFSGDPIPSLKSMDTKGLVVYLGSFSKILAPGLRVAWACAAPQILEKLMLAKQGADLQAPQTVQMEIDKYLETYDIDAHLQEICRLYQHKRDVMLNAMEKYFPACLNWSKPNGGLFIWVKLPEGVNAKDIMQACLKDKVMFITGSMFYANGGVDHTFRLNYSAVAEDKIVEGIKRIGSVLHNALSGHIK